MSSNFSFGRAFSAAFTTNMDSVSSSTSMSTIKNDNTDKLVLPLADVETKPAQKRNDAVATPVEGHCYYNNFVYRCGCTVAGPGVRVYHKNCDGTPLGEIRCANMTLHPKYPKIDAKCPKCLRRIVSQRAANIRGADDLAANFVRLNVTDKSTAPNASTNTIVDCRAEIQKSLVLVKDKSATESANLISSTDAYAPAPVLGQVKTTRMEPLISPEQTKSAKKSIKTYMGMLLEEKGELNIQLEYLTKHLVSAKDKSNLVHIKLCEKRMAELQKVKDSVEIKLALLEKPQLSWRSEESIISSSTGAQDVMKQEAKKEAAYYLPRTKRTTNMSSRTFVMHSMRRHKVYNAKTESAPVMKEVIEDGWDMLEEFEDHGWVDISPNQVSTTSKR